MTQILQRDPVPPEHLPPSLELSVSDLRRAAYAAEADPLYFQEQAGEVPEGTWLAKREEIRARYPEA
jgi:hypothetical protein